MYILCTYSLCLGLHFSLFYNLIITCSKNKYHRQVYSKKQKFPSVSSSDIGKSFQTFTMWKFAQMYFCFLHSWFHIIYVVL